jgi:hypothetical protein
MIKQNSNLLLAVLRASLVVVCILSLVTACSSESLTELLEALFGTSGPKTRLIFSHVDCADATSGLVEVHFLLIDAPTTQDQSAVSYQMNTPCGEVSGSAWFKEQAGSTARYPAFVSCGDGTYTVVEGETELNNRTYELENAGASFDIQGCQPAVGAEASLAPTQLQVPGATQALSPTPIPEEIVIEAEWPERMEIDRSDTIRVSLVRAAVQSLIPTPEIPGHTAVVDTPLPVGGTPSAPLEAAFGSDYSLAVCARLEGATLDVHPLMTECQSLDRDKVTWEWNIAPREAGRQVVNARIEAQWKPRDGSADVVQRLIWRAPLQIAVAKPLIGTDDLTVLTVLSSLLGLVTTGTSLYKLIDEKKASSEEPKEPGFILPGDA